MTIGWKPIQITLSCLDYWKDNPKLLTKQEAAKLEKSTRKLGRAGVLLVGPDINGRRALYDGHQRANIWRGLYGLDAPIWALESSRPLSDDERRAVSIMTITATGSLDWQKLAGWDFAELQDFGMDGDMLKALNNDANNLKELMRAEQAEPVDAEPQIDRAAELNEKWQVKTGDLWQIGEHRLLCGDSTKREDVERVMGSFIFSLGFADPPYGANVDEWDKEPIWNHDYLIDFCKVVAVTPGLKKMDWFVKKINMPYIWALSCYIPAYSARGMTGFSNWNPCIIYSKESIYQDKRDTLDLRIESGEANGEHHRGQKPPKFMKWILELFSSECDNILDVFAGSGTTLVACQNLSRKCRAIEISPNYCAVILERMATAFPELEIKRISE